MTLATRCPACGTVFRVVQDQLRVSQGWVRCGRCSEAFNALEAMVELPLPPPADEAEAPASVVVPPPAARYVDTAAAPAAGAEAPRGAPPPPLPPGEHPASWTTPDRQDPDASGPAPNATPLIEIPPGLQVVASDGAVLAADTLTASEAGRTEPDFGFDGTPAQPTSDATLEPGEQPALAPVQVAQTPAVASLRAAQRADLPPPPPPPPGADKAPSFLVQAERAERWRHPAVRAVLSLCVLLAAGGLAAQLGYTFRDRIAATAPALRPALQQACDVVGCRIGEYHQIEALSVESSGLVRVEGSPVYRLSVTLRNRAAVEVAAPALELSLTDAQGRLMARRVLRMGDLDLPLRSLMAGSELPIQASLDIGERPVSGYTVEIFYP